MLRLNSTLRTTHSKASTCLMARVRLPSQMDVGLLLFSGSLTCRTEFWFKTSTPYMVDGEDAKWIFSQQQIPTGKVSGCSNEMDSELSKNSWPKTLWLTGKVSDYLKGLPEVSNEEAAVKDLLRVLGDLLSTVNHFAQVHPEKC